jgi:hypothetical protein
MRDMAYSIHLAKRKTNKILEKYGTDNGYRMEDVNAKELYHALFEFYAWNEIVGHTITHKDGILYIDGAIKARFAHKDTLNKRLARAAITGPDYEGMILRRQEADHE